MLSDSYSGLAFQLHIIIPSFMTITLSNVVLIDQRGKYHLFDDLVVASRKIRQIQLPNLVIEHLLFINNSLNCHNLAQVCQSSLGVLFRSHGVGIGGSQFIHGQPRRC